MEIHEFGGDTDDTHGKERGARSGRVVGEDEEKEE